MDWIESKNVSSLWVSVPVFSTMNCLTYTHFKAPSQRFPAISWFIGELSDSWHGKGKNEHEIHDMHTYLEVTVIPRSGPYF